MGVGKNMQGGPHSAFPKAEPCYRCSGTGKVKPLRAKQSGDGASFGAVLRMEDAAVAQQRQAKWDGRMLTMAELVAAWSKDPGTKVGAVLAQGNRVVSVGYNGLPSKLPDVHLEDRDSKLSRTIHAELNAIFNAQRPVVGCTLYVVPLWPCDRCAAHIIQAGITRVVARLPKRTEMEASEKLKQWEALGEVSMSYFKQAGVIYDIVD
jgi:dCMP deaminase